MWYKSLFIQKFDAYSTRKRFVFWLLLYSLIIIAWYVLVYSVIHKRSTYYRQLSDTHILQKSEYPKLLKQHKTLETQERQFHDFFYDIQSIESLMNSCAEKNNVSIKKHARLTPLTKFGIKVIPYHAIIEARYDDIFIFFEQLAQLRKGLFVQKAVLTKTKQKTIRCNFVLYCLEEPHETTATPSFKY